MDKEKKVLPIDQNLLPFDKPRIGSAPLKAQKNRPKRQKDSLKLISYDCVYSQIEKSPGYFSSNSLFEFWNRFILYQSLLNPPRSSSLLVQKNNDGTDLSCISLLSLKCTLGPSKTTPSLINFKNHKKPPATRILTKVGGNTLVLQSQVEKRVIFVNIFLLSNMQSNQPKAKLVKKHLIKISTCWDPHNEESCLQIVPITDTKFFLVFGFAESNSQFGIPSYQNCSLYFFDIFSEASLIPFESPGFKKSLDNNFPRFTPVNNSDRFVVMPVKSLELEVPWDPFIYFGRACLETKLFIIEKRIGLSELVGENEKRLERGSWMCFSQKRKGEKTVMFVFVNYYSDRDISGVVIFDVYRFEVVRKLSKYVNHPISFQWNTFGNGFGLFSEESLVAAKSAGGSVWWFDQKTESFVGWSSKKHSVQIKPNPKTKETRGPSVYMMKYRVLKELRNSSKRKKFVSQLMLSVTGFSKDAAKIYHYEVGDQTIISANKYFSFK